MPTMKILATTLSPTEGIRIGDTIISYQEHKGRGEIVLKVSTTEEVAAIKKDGRERIIGGIQRLSTAAVICKMTIDSRK